MNEIAGFAKAKFVITPVVVSVLRCWHCEGVGKDSRVDELKSFVVVGAPRSRMRMDVARTS
jgi:hypothetical protein